jgi:hypothetical protein
VGVGDVLSSNKALGSIFILTPILKTLSPSADGSFRSQIYFINQGKKDTGLEANKSSI